MESEGGSLIMASVPAKKTGREEEEEKEWKRWKKTMFYYLSERRAIETTLFQVV